MPERRPFDLLNKALNNNVVVGMKGGVSFRGLMVSYDIHMNIVLEKAELISSDGKTTGLGEVLIRGDSVIYISPAQ